MALELRHRRRHHSVHKHSVQRWRWDFDKNLYQLKGYKAMELMNEFLNKWWTKDSINRLLIKFKDTSSVNGLRASVRARIAHTKENVDPVNDVVPS